mgnify:CR=1 FL=1
MPRARDGAPKHEDEKSENYRGDDDPNADEDRHTRRDIRHHALAVDQWPPCQKLKIPEPKQPQKKRGCCHESRHRSSPGCRIAPRPFNPFDVKPYARQSKAGQAEAKNKPNELYGKPAEIAEVKGLR